jgi:phosphatidate cytidylyltransferase
MTESLGKSKSDLGVRSLSAVVMVAVAGSALWLGGLVWTAFASLVALGVLWEWSRLALAITPSTGARIGWGIGGIVYVGLAIFGLLFLRSAPMLAGAFIVLTVVLSVIATDIGAYFAGRAIGGPKIAPKISPSKTWAGLAGGMLASGCVFAWSTIGFRTPGDLTPTGLPIGAIGVGMVIAVIAQAGDFFESWMKRMAGVKDSGNLIPGHGGLFDRVDGLLAVLFVVGVTALIAGI